MSQFYKYDFVSPEPIYAIVREELKSYFDTGAVDDLLFPVYTNKCLEKLGKGTHPIVPVILFVEDFTAKLPDNFYSVREAWYCGWTEFDTYTNGVAFYSQTYDTSTIQLSPLTTTNAGDCNKPECETIPAVYKTIRELPRGAFKRHFLLKPGNISFSDDCMYNYNETDPAYGRVSMPTSVGSAAYDSFDLRDGKFVTTFRKGLVEMLMYASDFDNLGNQMVPDNYRIREYIEAFIKFKVFETLTNQTNDETFNQLQQKMMLYGQKADEAYTMAETEIKKQDIYAKQRRIRKLKKSFDKYELPSGRDPFRFGRRRRSKY
jgi:hypothetical protein